MPQALGILDVLWALCPLRPPGLWWLLAVLVIQALPVKGKGLLAAVDRFYGEVKVGEPKLSFSQHAMSLSPFHGWKNETQTRGFGPLRGSQDCCPQSILYKSCTKIQPWSPQPLDLCWIHSQGDQVHDWSGGTPGLMNTSSLREWWKVGSPFQTTTSAVPVWVSVKITTAIARASQCLYALAKDKH